MARSHRKLHASVVNPELQLILTRLGLYLNYGKSPGFKLAWYCTEADSARSKALFLLKIENKTKMKNNFIIHWQNEKRSIPSAVGFRSIELSWNQNTIKQIRGELQSRFYSWIVLTCIDWIIHIQNQEIFNNPGISGNASITAEFASAENVRMFGF